MWRNGFDAAAAIVLAVGLCVGIAALGCGASDDTAPDDNIRLRKEVSIDGARTFFDANEGSTAPIAGRGANAEYRLVVMNIGTRNLIDVVVRDPTLGIDETPLVDIAAGETVILTAAGFASLAQPGVCRAAGDVINIASVEAVQAGTGVPVMDSDPAVVRCEDGNAAPEIVTTPTTEVVAWEPYSYDVEANDPDGDMLTYSLDAAPSGMTIDAATGLVEWTPTAAQVGANPATLRATDDGGLFDTQSFSIDVAENPNLLITSAPPTTATEDVLYTYDVEATDPEDDMLTFTLDIAPAGMTILTASGLIQWTPTSTQTGANSVTVRVTDDNGNSDTQSFSIDVTD